MHTRIFRAPAKTASFRRVSGLLLLLLALSESPIIESARAQSVADGASQKELEAQLSRARQRLAQVQRELERSQTQQRSETSALRSIETAISSTGRELAETARRIQRQTAEIAQLDRETQTLSGQLKGQLSALAAAVRHAWTRRQAGALQALLSIDRLSGAARRLRYQQLIAASQADHMHRIRRSLESLLSNRQQAAEQRLALDEERQRLARRKSTLARQRAERQEAIAALDQAIANQQQTSADITRDTQRLNELIAELASLFADIPPQLNNRSGMPPAAGALQLPVAGSVVAGAGRPKAGGLHRFGMLIEADEGEPVHALSYGRVAYADWLRGFGLLLIVDHGDGYLSLYGFNDSLYREVGDWVAAGDVIAAAGASGGRSTPGLYFELRRNGEPVDPRPWLERL